MEKGSEIIESGAVVVKGLKALDALFQGGLRFGPRGTTEATIVALQRENHAMRTALCALLVEAGGDVQFKIPKTFAFDIELKTGMVLVRRV